MDDATHCRLHSTFVGSRQTRTTSLERARRTAFVVATALLVAVASCSQRSGDTATTRGEPRTADDDCDAYAKGLSACFARLDGDNSKGAPARAMSTASFDPTEKANAQTACKAALARIGVICR
jgi:hypothetical protein